MQYSSSHARVSGIGGSFHRSSPNRGCSRFDQACKPSRQSGVRGTTPLFFFPFFFATSIPRPQLPSFCLYVCLPVCLCLSLCLRTASRNCVCGFWRRREGKEREEEEEKERKRKCKIYNALRGALHGGPAGAEVLLLDVERGRDFRPGGSAGFCSSRGIGYGIGSCRLYRQQQQQCQRPSSR